MKIEWSEYQKRCLVQMELKHWELTLKLNILRDKIEFKDRLLFKIQSQHLQT
jgi:hypothetical protein